MVKNTAHMEVPMSLEINYTNDRKDYRKAEYSLYAVCFHSGQLEQGHYTSKLFVLVGGS